MISNYFESKLVINYFLAENVIPHFPLSTDIIFVTGISRESTEETQQGDGVNR